MKLPIPGAVYHALISSLAVVTVSCASRAHTPMTTDLRCPNGHLYESIGEQRARSFRGMIVVRYPGEDTHPLPDALIQVLSRDHRRAAYSVRSGDDGSFNLQDVPLGAYEVLVCKEGFVSLEGRVALSREANTEEIHFETRLDW